MSQHSLDLRWTAGDSPTGDLPPRRAHVHPVMEVYMHGWLRRVLVDLAKPQPFRPQALDLQRQPRDAHRRR